MPVESILKLTRILVILSVFLSNSVLSLHANTYDEVWEKALIFFQDAQFKDEIDTLLTMRDREKMTPKEYVGLTLRAARRLYQLGDCGKALEELDQLKELSKISDLSYANLYLVKAFQIASLCDSNYLPHFKDLIDKKNYEIPHTSYAEALTDYGHAVGREKLRRKDFNSSYTEEAYYLSRAIGETLAYKGHQYPIKTINGLTAHLNRGYQYDLYEAISSPLINAFDSGKLNRLHPLMFEFITNYWMSQLWRGNIDYAMGLEEIVDNQIEHYDSIPIYGMAIYIVAKLMLSTYKNEDPKLVWNKFKSDKRIPESLLDRFQKIFLLFSLKYKTSFGGDSFKLGLKGIGATLNSDSGYTVVINLLPGGPAAKSGELKPGDRIVAIAEENNKFVNIIEKPISDVVELIKGEPGTKVRLKVLRGKEDIFETLEIAITRNIIKHEIGAKEFNSLRKFFDSDEMYKFYNTYASSLISKIYLMRDDYQNSVKYLKKYANQLSETVNIEIFRSFALRHDLNLHQRESIKNFVQVFSSLSTETSFFPNKEKYYVTQKVIEVLNSSYIPSSILHSSNKPNVYERLHKSSKLLFNDFSKEIKSKISKIKIGSGPDPEKTFDVSWAHRFEELLYLIYLTNKTTQKNYKYIKKPLIENIENLISTSLERDSVLFSLATTEDYVFQTCYYNGSYFTEIQKNFARLSEGVEIFRKNVDPTINKSENFDYKISNTLYSKLFSLLSKCAPKDKNIYIYLDPKLYNLPLNALLTKPSINLENNNWFGVKYDYTVLPYLGLLEKEFPKRELNSYFGLGNPDFQSSKGDDYTVINIDDLVVTRGGGYSKIDNLAPLPFTENEVHESSVLFDEKYVLLGKKATEENFRRTDYNNYDILHFATHGLISGEIDSLKDPGLVLTYPETPSSIMNDGYLSSSDIAELKFDGQLVLLSACNTAVDDGATNYFGLSDLSNSFLDAGAKNIVVSQWPIVSKSSAKFMKEYLKNIKQTNNKNSLAKTIAKFTKNSEYSHPKYWAPFIPIGKHWDTSTEKDQNFQTISTTNFGDDNFQDQFTSSIKYGDYIYAAVTSGSLSKDKSVLAPYLLKYDLKGNFISKHDLNIKGFVAPSIIGINKDKIYINGYSYSYKHMKPMVGSFDIERETFEVLINDISFTKNNKVNGRLITDDTLYLIIESDQIWEESPERDNFYRLIKYDLLTKRKSVYEFPFDKSRQFIYKNLITNVDGEINIFLNVDKEKDLRFNGRVSKHYIFVNDQLVLQNEHKNRFFSKYLPEEQILVGYTFDEVGDQDELDRRYIYNYLNSADIAFFTFKANIIKLHHELELPKAQDFKGIIKMGDNYLINGKTNTQLSWDFKGSGVEIDKDGMDYVNQIKLGFQKYYSNDPFLMLYDNAFNYVDSVVYPDRILAHISSMEKINDEYYMLFREYKGQKSVVTVNRL